MANPRKPASAHKLNGTYRPDRHGDRISVPESGPEKPGWLSAPAEVEWDRVMEMMSDSGFLCRTDSSALATYCELLAEFAAGPADFPAGRLGQMRLLMSELGLTPNGRAKMPERNEDKDNPFAGLDSGAH